MRRIGLEIHCQLTGLESKLFCPCRSDYRGMAPNTNTCPICMGVPGTLPRLNRGALRGALLIGMALGCKTPERLAFFRKNYFYPDLPKNFQTTQLDAYWHSSAGGPGSVDLGGDSVRIRRVQLEEDPGRITYGGEGRNRTTLVDYNRAGVALVEIVTEPDLEDPAHVRRFVSALADLLENLGVTDPGLEGAMRADANVSVGDGARVEVKNVGSFRDLERAVRFEITRQEELVSRGGTVAGETRQWDEGRRITVGARVKEDDPDYRYFPEGDIPWIRLDQGTASSLRASLPEGIAERRARYAGLGIPAQVADVLSSDSHYSALFDRAHTGPDAKEIANLVTSDLMGLAATREERRGSGVTAGGLRDLAAAVISGRLSRKSAKEALLRMHEGGGDLEGIIREAGLGNVTDSAEIAGVVAEVIAEEPGAAADAASNPEAVNYLVGMVMKKTRGRADPAATISEIRRALGG
ncbi:MAG: Asp-tRNA(Asn)/Glu-tRNA(Gln) amidotransferase subunit GatB [Nitrosopumilus sp.]|nr:Asp-tRNA(Asn)/Glu-tRNA(Gln) amidotransferase subunit GatB [Nitrosopumilus sp.]